MMHARKLYLSHKRFGIAAGACTLAAIALFAASTFSMDRKYPIITDKNAAPITEAECDTLNDEILELHEQKNQACESDADCVTERLGCPWGVCNDYALNRANDAKADRLKSNFRSCTFKVDKYVAQQKECYTDEISSKCGAPPPVSCVNHLCESRFP